MPCDPSLLDGVPLFQVLRRAQRRTLAESVDEVRLEPGMLFRRGDPGDALYVVLEGEVEVADTDTTGQRLVLERLAPGDFFGELSMLDGEGRSTDAFVRVPGRALRVEPPDLERLFTRHPAAALHLLKVMSRRLREADRMLRYGPVSDANREIEGRTTRVERLADLLAAFSGSFVFLLLHAAWFVVWLAINEGLVPGIDPFDPYPFGFLTMVVSLEAIFLSCCVLISQNRQAAKDHIRSEVEYHTNIKAGLEVSELHVKIDRLHEETVRRLAAIEGGRSATHSTPAAPAPATPAPAPPPGAAPPAG